MADQTTDPVFLAEDQGDSTVESDGESVVPADPTTENSDSILIKTLSDNSIATLQELKKLFERVQMLEEDNKKLQDTLDAKIEDIKALQAQLVDHQELQQTIATQLEQIQELKNKLDAQYLIIQKVRQEADKNMFSKGYTIPEDILSMVKNTSK